MRVVGLTLGSVSRWSYPRTVRVVGLTLGSVRVVGLTPRIVRVVGLTPRNCESCWSYP